MDEMCKDWKKYVQQMCFIVLVVFKVGDKSVIWVEVIVKDEELFFDLLFWDGMGELMMWFFLVVVILQNVSQVVFVMWCGWQCFVGMQQVQVLVVQSVDVVLVKGMFGGVM